MPTPRYPTSRRCCARARCDRRFPNRVHGAGPHRVSADIRANSATSYREHRIAVIALVVTLSPRAMRYWHAFSRFFALIMAGAAWIAVLDGDSDVLIASSCCSSLAAGSAASVEPTLAGGGRGNRSAGVAGYSVRAADPAPRLAIAWMALSSAALLSQLSSVQGARYRRKQVEQLAALAETTLAQA